MRMSKKTMLLASSALIATGILFTGASSAFAADTTIKAAISTQTAVTMQQASDIVTNANKGCTINEIKLKNEKGVNAYEVDITNSDNTQSEVKVNADYGTIIETKAKADKQSKNAQKTAIRTQQDTLNKKWTSMTAEQKEQVYVLKDAEFDAQIEKVKSHVTSGYKTQAEVDSLVSQIEAQKATMRQSGTAPKFDSIVNLPTVSNN